MNDKPMRLCVRTMRFFAGIFALLFGFVLSPLWTAKGSSEIPSIALWFAIVTVFLRGAFGGAFRKRNYLLIRSPFWTRRIYWNNIRGVDLVKSRKSSGLAIILNSGKHLNLWGTFGNIWFPAPDAWVGRASMELQKWIEEAQRP